MNGMPILRLQVDGTRHAIVQALENHNREIEAAVEAQIATIDIAAIVEAEVNRHVQPIISEAVKSLVASAVADLDWNWDFRKHLAKEMSALIVEQIKKGTVNP